jgi:hypothetical protein
MAGGIYDFRNLEQKQLKMAWSKTIFYLRSVPHNALELYLVKGFHIKIAVLGDFSIKSKTFNLFVVVFLCILAGLESYIDSQETNRSPAGEGGLSQGVLRASHFGRPGVICDSQSHGCAVLFNSYPD